MNKFVRVAGLSALLALNMATIAFAKEERTKIPQVELTIDYGINADGELEVDVINLGKGYSVDYYYINNEPDDTGWQKYIAPELMIELYADEDYYFKKGSASYFDLDGDESKLVSYNRHDDKDYLEVMLLLKPVKGEISNPLNLIWDESGKASWTQGFNNKDYEVTLHLNNSQKAKYETSNEYYNFVEDIVKFGKGNYKFKVQGIKKVKSKTYKSDRVESYEFEVRDNELEVLKKYLNLQNTHITNGGPGNKPGETDLKPINPSGEKPTDNQLNNFFLDGPNHSGLVKGWIRDENGWWYRNNDLTWTKNNWQKIDEKWYFFDEKGYMKTGWVYVGNKWYFLDSVHGDMKTGWVHVGGKWYYMDNEKGYMKTGYITVNGQQYYLSADVNDTTHIYGAMYENEKAPNGKMAGADGSLH